MERARYNTGLFPLPDNVLPVQLLGGTSEGPGVCHVRAQLPKSKATTRSQETPHLQTAAKSSLPIFIQTIRTRFANCVKSIWKYIC